MFGVFLLFQGIVVLVIVVSNWLHRNDFAMIMAFLADIIETGEIGEAT